MQNVKQPSKFLFGGCALSLLVAALLLSCTKEKAEIPNEDNAALNVAGISPQSSPRTSIVAVPFENSEFVPCANGGAGEDVLLSGYTAFVYQISWNENGFSLSYHGDNHQVTGVGLSSGESFVGSGGFEATVRGSWVNSQWAGTTIQQLRIVGQSTVFSVNYKLQLTVTPDGTVTVSVGERTIDCN